MMASTLLSYVPGKEKNLFAANSPKARAISDFTCINLGVDGMGSCALPRFFPPGNPSVRDLTNVDGLDVNAFVRTDANEAQGLSPLPDGVGGAE